MINGRIDRLHLGVCRGTVLTLGFAAATIAAVYFSAPALIELITGISNGEALTTGIFALRCSALFLPALHILFLYRAALQGAGDPVTPMLSGFMELCLRILSVVWLSRYIGRTAACIADGMGWLGAALLLAGRYICFSRSTRNRLAEGVVKNADI